MSSQFFLSYPKLGPVLPQPHDFSHQLFLVNLEFIIPLSQLSYLCPHPLHMVSKPLTYPPLILPVRDALPDGLFQLSDSAGQLAVLPDLCLDSLRDVPFQVLDLLCSLIHLTHAVPPLLLHLLLQLSESQVFLVELVLQV